MSNHTPTPKPLEERDLKDLFTLAFELHGRAVMQWDNEAMHKAYEEARQELWKRIKCLTGIPDPDQWVEDMKAENQRLKDLVSDLAAWSNKYPRERIYSMGSKSTMDNELIAMEERAKALLETNKIKP